MNEASLKDSLYRKNLASYDGPLDSVISKPARPWGALWSFTNVVLGPLTTRVQFPVWHYQLVGYLELNQVNYGSKHAGYHLLSALTEDWKTVLPGLPSAFFISHGNLYGP